MQVTVAIEALTTHITPDLANNLLNIIQKSPSVDEAWANLLPLLPTCPFAVSHLLFKALHPTWPSNPDAGAAWFPTPEITATANITQLMHEVDVTHVPALHEFSVEESSEYWQRMIDKLQIVLSRKPTAIVDLTQGVKSPNWLPGAKLNITDSCFNADPQASAIVYADPQKKICSMSYQELNQLANCIANSLVAQGFVPGDAIAITMPMHRFTIAIYLGIIKMGGVVVSIADSFSSEEIAARLRISKAKAIFTQDFIAWAGKKIPLYEKVKSPKVKAIVLIGEDPTLQSTPEETRELAPTDCYWADFFLEKATHFEAVQCDPMTACNILFSSGTTAEPKAIVWNHTTPIKVASDAFLHQNIQPNDRLAWPTNLGWMMGPWLIYAALINRASLVLYTEAPKDRAFGEFIQDAKVTMLGVVPTLVSTWRQTQCMEGLDWRAIKVFSSTGECSNASDMLYLMYLGNYKPVIEYCGGTEIGGAYLSSTVIEKNYPALFGTPVMGINIVIIDEEGKPATMGEVAMIPPSIGLSTQLLNADHYQVYFKDMPIFPGQKVLRRHGDQIKQFANGYYCILGRVDDTMNLGGIKTSAAELERTLVGIADIHEVAAIAIPPPDNGPSLLVIYAATNTQNLVKQNVMKEMQKRINHFLNPLFKIYDLVFVTELPKTASNKIMRRVLRKRYLEKV